MNREEAHRKLNPVGGLGIAKVIDEIFKALEDERDNTVTANKSGYIDGLAEYGRFKPGATYDIYIIERK